jgi:hypothetical protein
VFYGVREGLGTGVGVGNSCRQIEAGDGINI